MRKRMAAGASFGAWLAAMWLAGSALAAAPPPPVQTPLSPTKIPQFVQPLDVLDLTGQTQLPVAMGTAIDLSICEFQTNVLPPGTFGKLTPAPATWVWGYQVGATCAPNTDPVTGLPIVQPHSYLGPIVIADRHVPTAMTYYNRLPDANMSNVKAYTTATDQTLIWGDPLGLLAGPTSAFSGIVEGNDCWLAAQNLVPPALMPASCNNNYGFLALQPTPQTYSAPIPAAVHIHGGEVPSVLDGGPDAWWTPNGIYGHGFYSFGGVADAAQGKATYVYPNGQEAAPVWFHDHMLGATRLNVYAGIAGGYVIKEDPATLAPGLHPLGLSDATTGALTEPTIPLIVQDRMFDTAGQLFFPNVGINPEHPFWVPEFVGDVIVVNGKAWPYLNVQPKRYKFLFLNGSNARAYEMSLMSKTTGLKGPSLWVIGNDQGYLDTPQLIDPNVKLNGKLAMMPGERYEVIVDFSTVAGQVIEMRNTARTPYVGGAPVNGTTTGKIIQFRVAPGVVADNTFNPAVLPAPAIRATPMVRLTDPLLGTVAPGVTVHKVRRLTLNEVIAAGGPLEVLVNNTLYDGSKARPYNDFTPITTMNRNTTWYSELPHEGETELWEIVNLTADAHPMHPHLVAFQVLNRQPLDVLGYTAAYNTAYVNAGLFNPATGLPLEGYGPPLDYNCGMGAPGRGVLDPALCVLGGNPDPALTLSLLGPPVPPMPQEIGWKDTVQALPNMVTRILVRFGKPELPADTAADDPALAYDFSPNGGHGYVWHCHIVDHEDNEMMRPFTVNAGPAVCDPALVVCCDPAVTDPLLPGFCNPGDPTFKRTFVKGVDY